MTLPVVFAAPADIELDPDPIRADWVIEGNPQVRSKYLARSVDGASSVVAWSCTAGRFVWCYKVDEMLHVISGEVFVTDEKGMIRRLGPGRHGFLPRRRPQRLAHHARGEEACHVPPPPAAAVRPAVAGLEQSAPSADRFFRRPECPCGVSGGARRGCARGRRLGRHGMPRVIDKPAARP